MPKTKHIFVVGGVMSSVGKGVATASIGKILQSKGYDVACIKSDMYVNLDAGTIRPAEHGEVFVGECGIEADQDLGNYERFTDTICTRDNYLTTGQVYQEVINRERNLEYEGEDVEVVPDIPNEIIRRITTCGKKNNADIVITELGGTVGEYQVLLFLEAARILKAKNPEDVYVILVSYLPTPKLLGEQKSKPTQYAIRTLNSAGITPDFILCRAEKPLDTGVKKTISTVCSLPPERVISAPDVESIYDVPVNFEKENLGNTILKTMGLPVKKENGMKDWEKLSQDIKLYNEEVNIGVVGKYFNSKSSRDTYISVIESIQHASWFHNKKPNIHWIESEDFENDPKSVEKLKEMDGIIVPGGFGERGTEGIMLAIEYIRNNNIPFLGICYGMQLACAEYARNVLNLKGANSVEINPDTKHPIIIANPYQQENILNHRYGGTMRLGAYTCKITEGTKTYESYGKETISERHRHRYEFNNEYKKQFEDAGLTIAGIYEKNDLVEIVELPDHPFFIGVQFHPEFQSRPLKPHPLFRDLIKTAIQK